MIGRSSAGWAFGPLAISTILGDPKRVVGQVGLQRRAAAIGGDADNDGAAGERNVVLSVATLLLQPGGTPTRPRSSRSPRPSTPLEAEAGASASDSRRLTTLGPGPTMRVIFRLLPIKSD